MIYLIVARDNKFGIGRGSSIPWDNSFDLKLFYDITFPKYVGERSAVIFGYNTFLSMKSPLSNRTNIVMTNKHYDELRNRTDIVCIRNKDELINQFDRYVNIYICGGKQIYELLFNLVNVVYETVFEDDYKCDVFIKDLYLYDKFNNMRVVFSKKVKKNNVSMTFNRYELISNIKPHDEYQYLNLLEDVMINGDERQTRNSITKSSFGGRMCFILRNNVIPVLTT
ncbi:Dihydrofolate reductase [uncultured archaeon]|nr:Dihydrofolate reductase [uncultured archaeon]